MATQINSKPTHRSFRSRWGRFLWMPLVGVFSLLLPMTLAWFLIPGALLAKLLITLALGPGGLAFLLIGIAYLQLRVELTEESFRLKLPPEGSEPWFPWRLRRATFEWDELQLIECSQRANPYASNGQDLIVLLHTTQGVFYLNSFWMQEFHELMQSLQQRSQAEIVGEPLESNTTELTSVERRYRLLGNVLFGGLFLVMIGTGIYVLSGQKADQGDTFLLIVFPWLFLPLAEKLAKYRQPISRQSPRLEG